MASSNSRAEVANLGLAVLGVAVALAVTGGSSFAQVAAKPAAAPPAGAAADAAKIEKGRGIFADYGCASCHSLKDAGSTGHVGPALDGNSSVSEDFVTSRVTNGQGQMPAFGGQLSPDEIAAVAAYVTKVAEK